MLRCFTILLSVFMISNPARSIDIHFKGQANAWFSFSYSKNFMSQFGLRYIPALSAQKQIKKIKFDAEISINTYGIISYDTNSLKINALLKPYRFWVRMSTNQFELRAGLQKINFGSATLMRPLMWFDRMDPRDPLQLTDGVYALLARYYFLNNATIWLWGLYGNKNTKGWETEPGNRKRPEFGGRFQYPVFTGEMAVSYHNREVDFSKTPAGSPLKLLKNADENRIGIDGKWDIGIGLWFEGVLKYQDIPKKYLPWQQQLNIGFDYTFNIGDGLKMINEFLWTGVSGNAFGNKKNVSISALSLSYPVGVLDNISGMVYYDWTNKNWYRFLSWQRRYDKISLYLMLFWNPDEFAIYQNMKDQTLFTGAGAQFMFVFNY